MKVRSVKVITLKVNGRSYEFDVGEGRGEMPRAKRWCIPCATAWV